MPPIGVSTLLLSQPLPLSSIALGRLVRDPLCPDVQFHQPDSQPDLTVGAEDTAGAPASSPPPSFSPVVAVHHFENFQDILSRSSGTSLELKLFSLLSFSPKLWDRTSATILTSRLCAVHQLRNTDAYFAAVCREPAARAWLEEELQDAKHLYIVCGFKTLVDARVHQTANRATGFETEVGVPVLTAVGVPVPLPGLDVSAGVIVQKEDGEDLSFDAPGELVFAVQYRRIRFGLFSTKKVDNAFLEKGNRWKSLVMTRGTDEDGDEQDGIQVDLTEDLVNEEDLDGEFECLEVNGERVLYEDEHNSKQKHL